MVPFRFSGLLLSVICLGGAVSARAEDLPPPPPESGTAPEMLASPYRIPGRSLDADRFPGNATVLTRDELKRSGATTIQEAIANTEGTSWFDTRGFGTGSDATLNLRGVVNGSRSGILVLVDGVR